MEHEHNCWQCGSADAGSLFCRYCNSLQEPVPDYYAFFGLPRTLSIGVEDLQNRFYSLSRLLHPDRFTRRSEQEKHYSLEASSILNDAYRVLRDPIRRAEYVLKQAGYEIGEQRSKDVPPELLEEVFELNMALDELRMGDDDVLPQLDSMRHHFLDMLASIDAALEEKYQRHDKAAGDAGKAAVLDEIKSALHRRRYIRNLVDEVDRQLSSRNA